MDAPGVVPDSINCHACAAALALTGFAPFTHIECSQCHAVSVVPLQFGNLLLLSAIGIGGMGTVYKAVDLQLNRYVAVKILRQKLAADPQFIEKFTREARAAAAVNHPNVAQVYAFDQFGGQYFLTMELLEHGSLDDRITRLGKVPEADVLQIGAGIAAGLRAAHERGLLHRDIKPGNILFNEEGQPKIVDFGLASAQHEAAAETTADGGVAIWGTPYYIAPEKLRGQPEDFRSDMYSLGATLFHALAGRPPFDAKTASEVVAKHATTPAFNLKTYNPTVQDYTAHVIGRTIAKGPNERYETYDALIHDLEHAEALLREAKAGPAIITETGERVPITSIVVTLAAIVITIVICVILWINRAKFGLESSPPPPAPVETTNKPATPAVAPAEVNFNDDVPWVKSWNAGLRALSQQQFQAALIEAENIRQLTRGHFRQRQWAYFLEGLTLIAADRAAEAQFSFNKALNPTVAPRVPDKITPTNLVDPLTAYMLDQLSESELTAALPKWPDWAAAFSQIVIALRQPTTPALRAYQNLPVNETQRWAYTLQPLAKKIADEIESIPATVNSITQKKTAGDLAGALQQLRDVHSQTKLSALKTQLDQLEAGLLQLQADAEKKIADQKRADEEARQAEIARQQQAAEAAKQTADTEVQQVAAVEGALAGLLANYNFKAVLAKYDALAEKITTPAGKTALEQRRAGARWLLEFKTQLAADFQAKPYDATLLETRGTITKPQGKLARATDTQIYFQLPYGELATDWREVLPGSFQKAGEFYYQAGATTEKPAARARRCVALAAFTRAYRGKSDVYLKQAAQLDPAIQKEIDAAFGQ